MSDVAYIKSRGLWIRYLPKPPIWRIQDREDASGYLCIFDANYYNLNTAIRKFFELKNEHQSKCN